MRTFHTVEGKTRRQAERARDALILEFERKGGDVGSSMSVREFMEQFLAYKEGSGTIEPSTARGYRHQVRGYDMPKEELDQEHFECIAAAYLAESEVEGLISIRYDVVSLLMTCSKKALLRNHKNVLNDGR